MFRTRLIFEKQWLHALLLAVLLSGMVLVTRYDGVRAGNLWGMSTQWWFWLAIGIAVTHQVFVWFCWRTELHASWLSGTFKENAFTLYAVGFSILGIMRVAVVFIVAFSNQDTLTWNPIVLKFLAVIVLLPSLYLFYSVKRYFGFKRAFGVDHFERRYRSLPFERRGIFRFTRNGMYVYGFLLLWVPALWWGSVAGLAVALFNHLYIWTHYFATELPDMRRIYSET